MKMPALAELLKSSERCKWEFMVVITVLFMGHEFWIIMRFFVLQRPTGLRRNVT